MPATNADEPNAEGNADAISTLSDDAQGLGPLIGHRIAIGHVDEMIGEGGVGVPGFVVNKNEILQLVRYWAAEVIDLDWMFFLYSSTGCSEWRTREFANRRLNTISKFIGKEEVKRVFRDAEQAFGKRVDQRA
jgi:hypothetical protein